LRPLSFVAQDPDADHLIDLDLTEGEARRQYSWC
jgi:hypothetical protein